MILRHANKPRKVLPSAGTPPAQGTVRAAPTIARVDAPTRPAASEAAPKAASQPDPAVAVAPAREQPEASPGSAALSPSTVSATDSVVMASATQAVVPAAIPSADGVAVEAATTQTAVASKALILLSSVEPEFPARLVRTLGKGSVVVRFEVQSDGSVASTAVVKTSHKGLNEAAQAAVAAWRFKPVGEPASGITELRFE